MVSVVAGARSFGFCARVRVVPVRVVMSYVPWQTVGRTGCLGELPSVCMSHDAQVVLSERDDMTVPHAERCSFGQKVRDLRSSAPCENIALYIDACMQSVCVQSR